MAVGVYNPPTSGGTSVTTPTNPAGGGPEPSTILPGENGIGAATPVTSVGTTESANPTALPSEIASQPLIGGTAGVGSTGATPEKPYSEEQLVHELAT